MPRDEVNLADVLDSARLAMSYVQNVPWEEFSGNVQLQDAVIRRLELIGEAARRVSEEGRRQYAQLPWSQMIGMRNVMIHQYDAVDLGVVWDTIQRDLPPLVRAIEEIFSGGDGE
ncbi:MAG: DUF86 domain-containing protein [Planctomycetales bacterium]